MTVAPELSTAPTNHNLNKSNNTMDTMSHHLGSFVPDMSSVGGNVPSGVANVVPYLSMSSSMSSLPPPQLSPVPPPPPTVNMHLQIPAMNVVKQPQQAPPTQQVPPPPPQPSNNNLNINIVMNSHSTSSNPNLSQLNNNPSASPVNTIPANNALCPPNTIPPSTVLPPKTHKPTKKSKSKMGSGSGPSCVSQGENTGRWTAEEHRLFLEGLEKHGKGWKKIASLIKSRTVVQIRTHAQKYFQKLAKARQNGEEGDVSMEGRGGSSAPPSGMALPPMVHEKLSVAECGNNKRKCISSVVESAQAKRRDSLNVMPAIAPSLAPYVLQNSYNQIPQLSNMDTGIANHPGAALEDSLYRYLTPNTRDFGPPPPNTCSQTNPIPNNENNSNNPQHFIVLPHNSKTNSSEPSPTCVTDLTNFSHQNNRLLEPDAPSWYARGADVDELLNEAYALDWLADSGDLYETTPPTVSTTTNNYLGPGEVVSLSSNSDGSHVDGCYTSTNNNNCHATNNINVNLATDALPPVVSSTCAVDMDSLPNLFDTAPQPTTMNSNANKTRPKLSTPNLFTSANGGNTSSGNLVDENFNVFDSALDEQAFVSALLESNENAALSVLN